MPGMTWNARTCSAVPVSYMPPWIAQGSPIVQGHVHDTGKTAVQRLVRPGRLLEGEPGRGESRQRQPGEQPDGDASAAGEVPPPGECGRDGRHLAAADRQPPAEGSATGGQEYPLSARP